MTRNDCCHLTPAAELDQDRKGASITAHDRQGLCCAIHHHRLQDVPDSHERIECVAGRLHDRRARGNRGLHRSGEPRPPPLPLVPLPGKRRHCRHEEQRDSCGSVMRGAAPCRRRSWPPATSPRPQSARGRAGRGVSVVRLSGSLRADVKVGEAVSNSARWCHDAMATRSVDPAGETNAAAGNSSVTMNPPDPTFAAYAVPPCTSKLRFAIASPSPVPVPHSTKQSPDDWNRTRR